MASQDSRNSAARPPKRRNSRRDATRLAIIETAESLFAEEGIDGVSLRQIGTATGARNPAVVAYHFGDKEALIEAILAHRLPHLERRRAVLARGLSQQHAGMEEVLRAIWLPIFEQTNDEGRRSYAAFLASLGRSKWGWVWSGADRNLPVTMQLANKVRQLMPQAARAQYWERIVASTALITTSIATLDRRKVRDRQAEQALFDDAMRMAAAALAAPCPQTCPETCPET